MGEVKEEGEFLFCLKVGLILIWWNAVSVGCLVFAGFLLWYDKGYWGWFVLIALIFAKSTDTDARDLRRTREHELEVKKLELGNTDAEEK